MVEAARAGKAIFCEKPVSLDLAEVDRALAVVQEAGVPFQIGFNRRFDPGHAAVAAAVADGTVGEPQLARISSRDPAPPPTGYIASSGGIFLDMTIHDFDMARFVVGSEVVEVFARGAVRIDPAFADADDVDTAVDDAGARERLPDDDRQLAPGRLRLRPARRGLRLGRHGHLGEPARARGGHPHARRRAGRDAAVLLPRALHPELPARVGGVHRRGRERHDAAGRRRRRPRAAGDRPGGAGSRCAKVGR